MSEKLTKEQIERHRASWLQATRDFESQDYPKEMLALCDLALVGLEVQPRPLSEAPKKWSEEFVLLWIRNGQSIELRRDIDGEWWHRMIEEEKQRGGTFYITHYLPLSSLPKPK